MADIDDDPQPPAAPLTVDEHDAVEMAGRLWNLLCRIVGDGPSRGGDLNELVGHVHAIQHAVMAQAAARAYSDRYRLLGGDPPGCPDDGTANPTCPVHGSGSGR